MIVYIYLIYCDQTRSLLHRNLRDNRIISVGLKILSDLYNRRIPYYVGHETPDSVIKLDGGESLTYKVIVRSDYFF